MVFRTTRYRTFNTHQFHGATSEQDGPQHANLGRQGFNKQLMQSVKQQHLIRQKIRQRQMDNACLGGDNDLRDAGISVFLKTQKKPSTQNNDKGNFKKDTILSEVATLGPSPREIPNLLNTPNYDFVGRKTQLCSDCKHRVGRKYIAKKINPSETQELRRQAQRIKHQVTKRNMQELQQHHSEKAHGVFQERNTQGDGAPDGMICYE